MGTSDSSFLIHDKLRDHTPLDIGIEGLLRITHALRQIIHQGLGAARELRHLLHHIEGIILFCRCKGASSSILLCWRKGALGLILLHHLDFLVTHLDGASLLALLHGLLLLRFVIHIVGYSLGIEGQSEAHDGDENE